MRTTLTVEIEYDPTLTDPEGLACAMDRLLETALSTPDILDECGNPTVGEFFVANESAATRAPKAAGQELTHSADSDRTATDRWVLYSIDTDTLLTTRTYDSYAQAAEDANQVNDILVLPLTIEELHA